MLRFGKEQNSRLCGQPIFYYLFRIQRPRDEWVCLPMCAQFHHLTMCGESGIRTPDTVSSMTVFKTVPFNHSGNSPNSIPIRILSLCFYHLNYYRYRHVFFLLLPLLCTLASKLKRYQLVPMPNT